MVSHEGSVRAPRAGEAPGGEVPGGELCDLELAQASELIRTGALAPLDYLDALLARTQALEPRLCAYVAPLFEAARTQARTAGEALAKGHWRGPLHGIPVGLKDIFDLAGTATTGHSRLFLDRRAGRDARCVERLKAAGALIPGKTATYELAFGGPSQDLPFPLARNPWDPERFTSGSSTGSAVGVAAGFFPAAVGSDTAGSVRGPAALQGITGLKPTYDAISRQGALALAWSLDHVGPLARSARDCELLLAALAEPPAWDRLCARRRDAGPGGGRDEGLRGLRIGLVRHFYARDCQVDGATQRAIAAAVETLRAAGAEVREIALSPLRDYHAACLVILLSEAYALYRQELARPDPPFGENFRDRVRSGALLSAADYVDARRARRSLQGELAAAFAGCDLLMTAVAPGAAPPLESVPKFAILQGSYLTSPFNVGGGPAIALPAGLSQEGLPVAFQLAGRPWDDLRLLEAAKAFQALTTHHLARPPLARLAA